MGRFFLGLILLVGLLLRIVAIDQIPAGFTPDEASFGYDAYSIIRSGRDQWGKLLPTVFESFGDYKSPLYTYLTVPSVFLFGLNKFSVRLPNALVGTFSIYATFLLASYVSKSLNSKLSRESLKMIPYLAALLIAISPWHIMMSRGAFEANLTTFFLTIGIYFFMKGTKNSKYLILSVIFLSLNMFTYHSAKFVTPIIFVILCFMNKGQIFKIDRSKIIAFVIGISFLVLFIGSMLGGSSTRIKNTSILSRALLEASDERIKAINSGMDPVLARIIYNKYQAGLRRFTINYLSYFSPQFYFTNGPGEGTYGMVPGRGVLVWLDAIFLLSFGAFFVKFNKDKILWVIIVWFLISPIPAALSIGPGYAANRAEVMLTSLQILMAIGFTYIYEQFIKFKYAKLAFGALALIYVGFIAYFGLEYYFLSPLKNGRSMLWGSLKSAEYVVDNFGNKKVLVSRSLSEPHIYIAFASKFDPSDYQKYALSWEYQKMGLDWVDQMPFYQLGNYTFSNVDKFSLIKNEFDVVVGKPEEFETGQLPSKIIYNPDGSEAVYIFAN